LLRKQQKTLGGYFFLPHPVHLNSFCGSDLIWSYRRSFRAELVLISRRDDAHSALG